MNANEPAFPWEASPGNQKNLGLTKRELLAAMAMQGLLANYEAQRQICNTDPRYQQQADGEFNFADVIAINSREFADALLAELEKKEAKP